MRNLEINTTYDKKDKTRRFANNFVSTSKYNCFNFLPKNLFLQFSKFANVYFLAMALLELIPAISDSGGAPVMLAPLSFVVLVSMIKDIFEDLQRHRADS